MLKYYDSVEELIDYLVDNTTMNGICDLVSVTDFDSIEGIDFDALKSTLVTLMREDNINNLVDLQHRLVSSIK